MLTLAYAKVGGLKGSGFSSPVDMVKNIKFWKIVKKEGEVIAAAFYKDKGGRKRVAVCTNGTDEGKDAIAQIMIDDLDRAYFEISGPSLKFLCSRVGELKVSKYAINVDKVIKITGDIIEDPVETDYKEMSLYDELVPFFYRRDIGGKSSLKVMLGKPLGLNEMAISIESFLDI